MKPAAAAVFNGVDEACEDVEIQGHIIDSLILPKILDHILNNGGTFRIQRITIGQSRHDPSYAVLQVRAADRGTLDRILAQIADHGAVPLAMQDCRLVEADIDGAFPGRFLQHDESADRGAVGRPLGRRRGPGDGLRHSRRSGRSHGEVLADERVPAGPEDRRRAHGRARLSRATVAGRPGLRLYGQPRLHGEAEGAGHPRDRPRHGPAPPRGREDPPRRRPGDHPQRQRRVPAAADPHGLRRRALRRQRPGDPRHRAGHVRHEPRGVPRPRGDGGSGTRAPLAGDQPHSPRRRHSPGRRKRQRSLPASCASASAAASISSSPAASATTGPCRKSLPTSSSRSRKCGRKSAASRSVS